MPQSQTSPSQSPINGAPQGDYQSVDPRKDPIAFVFQNKEALGRMDSDKAVKFVDMLFRRVALPKYQKVNQQRPLDEEELEGLRLQFAARMFGIPYEQETKLKDPKVEYGAGAKALATVEGAGAGVLGGIKTIADLSQLIDKHLGPLGKAAGYVHGAIGKAAGKGESRAWEDASRVAPSGASAGAAVGHQIPAAIATHGVGELLPGMGKTAPLAARVITSAGRGAAEGTTFEASRPGGDPASGAQWGGVLGAAFPMLGKMFGLGRKAVSSTAPEAAKAVGSATAEGATAKAAAVAAKAAEENPSIGKTLGQVEKRVSEGKSPTGTERRAGPLSEIKGPDPIRDARISELRNLAKTGTAEEKAYAESALKDMREHPFESGATLGEDIRKARAKEGSKPITKLSPEETGPKIRAKEGKPASPAQQAADRERIAAKRELSKKEEFGSALEKHAQGLAGKYTPGSLNMMHIPELEEAMKDFPNGESFLRGFQKLRKQGRLSDELYFHEMKDWLEQQFGAQ